MSLFKKLDQIVLASNNQGKLREFAALFDQYNIKIIPQGELNVTECDEPYHTFVENALKKARHASQQTGLPAVADDSGIVVPALNGAPMRRFLVKKNLTPITTPVFCASCKSMRTNQPPISRCSSLCDMPTIPRP